MNTILALGLGNEYLRDDAVGLLAVRTLKEKYQDRIDIVESPESGLRLLDYIIGYEKVLILDSILKENEQPGAIEEIDIMNLEEDYSPVSPHYIGLPYTLKLAQNLQLQLPKVIKVIALHVEDPYTLLQELTPSVQASFNLFVEFAASFLEQWLNENP